jgi:hypothetical protein
MIYSDRTKIKRFRRVRQRENYVWNLSLIIAETNITNIGYNRVALVMRTLTLLNFYISFTFSSTKHSFENRKLFRQDVEKLDFERNAKMKIRRRKKLSSYNQTRNAQCTCMAVAYRIYKLQLQNKNQSSKIWWRHSGKKETKFFLSLRIIASCCF